MPPEQHFEHLLSFFKVLGDPSRLKIVGLLSEKSRTVEQLGELLGIGVSTISHHLTKLSDAGLVTARTESYYRIYSLKTDVLTAMAKSMLQQAEKPAASQQEDLDSFDKKVLATFLTPDGRISAFPVQEKKNLVLLRHVLKSFEHGVKYPEKRVNQILSAYNIDTARLRRELVVYKFMQREGGGGKYWRIDDNK